MRFGWWVGAMVAGGEYGKGLKQFLYRYYPCHCLVWSRVRRSQPLDRHQLCWAAWGPSAQNRKIIGGQQKHSRWGWMDVCTLPMSAEVVSSAAVTCVTSAVNSRTLAA